MSRGLDREPSSVSWVAVIATGAIGIALRTWQLDDQLILDDEFWTLQAAVVRSTREILTNHQWSDYSIPLALWCRMLIETTGITEWGFRFPVWLIGCLTLPLTWWFARRLGALEAVATIALVGVTPILVLYSRYSRPYIAVFFFTLVVLAAWQRWMETGKPRWGAASAVAGALAIWLNPVAAPAVVAIWMAGIACIGWTAQRHSDSSASAGVVPSVLVGAAGCLLALLLYAPSLSSLIETNFAKPAATSATASAWWAAAKLLLGAQSDVVLLWLLATAALGAIALVRTTHGLLVVISLSSVAAPLCALFILSPHGSDSSFVLARYLIGALPGLLILIGAGFATQGGYAVRAAGMFNARWPIETPATLLLVAFYAGVGPLPDVFFRTNGFTSHPDAYASDTPNLNLDRMPRFYSFLAESESTRTVVEAPWPRAFRYTPYAHYQALHRKAVWSVSHDPSFAAPGVELDRVRPIASLAASRIDADYVVLHGHVSREMLHVAPGPHPGRLGDRVPLSGETAPPHALTVFQRTSFARSLSAARQNPVLRKIYLDEWITVFAVGSSAANRYREWETRQGTSDRDGSGHR